MRPQFTLLSFDSATSLCRHFWPKEEPRRVPVGIDAAYPLDSTSYWAALVGGYRDAIRI